MKAILLQILVLFCFIAAIVGIKVMDLPAWFTYPLVAIVVVLTLLGFACAYYERQSV
jgi:hypothetical protein